MSLELLVPDIGDFDQVEIIEVLVKKGDNLKKNDPVGERLSNIAKKNNILLMVCDQCAVRRNLAEGTLEQCGSGDVKAKGLVDGVVAGCFPQLYQALGTNPPDQVITL